MTTSEKARRFAVQLERDAEKYPEERGELLIEAAGQWGWAGESERALRIYDDLIAMELGEDSQLALTEKVALLADLGRGDEADAEISNIDRTRILPGPALLIAEHLEYEERPEEALTWFNIACRDLMTDDGELAETTLFARAELRGRRRVRQVLGLQPDSLDLRSETLETELALLDRAEVLDMDSTEVPSQPNVGSFFVRSEVARAFAEGLVHGAGSADPSAYFGDVERGWRNSRKELGASRLRVLPTTVDDLLQYADDHDRDPKDPETRADHLMDRVREGAPTLDWPSGRNSPCWCGSGRKYKKCCGSPAVR